MEEVSSDLLLVLSRPPEGFPTRRAGTVGMCALYSLKALIEGKYPERTIPVSAYAQDIFSKISGFMLPFSLLRVLRKYHISYEVFSGRGFPVAQKLEILKRRLAKGPILLLIGNAYGSGKRPTRVRALHHRHYITLWGYDEKKQIFFIYDSNTKKRVLPDMPIGNTYLTYRQLIRYWSIGATWMMRFFGVNVFYK
ncbi:MAG: hypothetical protein LBU27_00690 [Candidatus Peribacteria bacterium]|jgi:hypothetical protein|nr:hypothetical protein [Candidatus Peribacteria bacterium]